MGGAMFGDNLSFISDTTIAACNGQGCKMTDKFKENFFIALPAAIVSLVIIYSLSVKNYSGGVVQEEYHLIQAIPYILVLAGGILGTDYRNHKWIHHHDCDRDDRADGFAWKYGRRGSRHV